MKTILKLTLTLAAFSSSMAYANELVCKTQYICQAYCSANTTAAVTLTKVLSTDGATYVEAYKNLQAECNEYAMKTLNAKQGLLFQIARDGSMINLQSSIRQACNAVN